MEAKHFVTLHLFELVYLCILAVLPFLVAIPVVGITIILILVYLGSRAIYRKITFRKVPLEDKTVFITGCDSGIS